MGLGFGLSGIAREWFSGAWLHPGGPFGEQAGSKTCWVSSVFVDPRAVIVDP